MNSLLSNNAPKSWANLYINKLNCYNGIKLGNSDLSIDVLEKEQFIGNLVVNDGGGINEADVNARTLEYVANITTTTLTKTVNIHINAASIQGSNLTDAITTEALPEYIRPYYYIVMPCLIPDNISNPGPILTGSIHLAADGVITIKALPGLNSGDTVAAFTGGVEPANIMPLNDLVFEFVEHL